MEGLLAMLHAKLGEAREKQRHLLLYQGDQAIVRADRARKAG
jgi:hypothetical protein